VAQVLHVYAYVGVDEDVNAKIPSPVLHEKDESRSFVATTGEDQTEWRKSFRLQPGERRGWWSSHPKPAQGAGIATVHGAVCDHRTTILLDSSSDTSILSLDLAHRLGLTLCHDEKLKVKGIGGITTYVTAKVKAKVTLGVSVAYETELWCGNIGQGIDCLLGMDFMISASVRLCAYEGMVRLPDEETVPMVSSGLKARSPRAFQSRLSTTYTWPQAGQ
jgi:hypothetical protein